MSNPSGEMAAHSPDSSTGNQPPPTLEGLHQRLGELEARQQKLQADINQIRTHIGSLAAGQAAETDTAPPTAEPAVIEEVPPVGLYNRFENVINFGRFNPETQAARIGFIAEVQARLHPYYQRIYNQLLNDDRAGKNGHLPPHPLTTDPNYLEKQAAYVKKYGRTYRWREVPVDGTSPYEFSTTYLPGSSLAVTGFSVKTTSRERLGVTQQEHKATRTTCLTFDQGQITTISHEYDISKKLFQRREYGGWHFNLDLNAMTLHQKYSSSDEDTYNYSDREGHFYRKSMVCKHDDVQRKLDLVLEHIPLAPQAPA